jgi:hexosaminidase
MIPHPAAVTRPAGTHLLHELPRTGRIDPALRPEEYRLRVTPSTVDIVGGDEAGVFYAIQTLRQLLPHSLYRAAVIEPGPWEVPCVEIADAPRFRWRGCMLDVARHFLPKADVLRYVDLLAVHKLNVLHLHLTDDQGWRLPVPQYPRLTEVGGWRAESMAGPKHLRRYDGRPHGGYYSADDLREIVAYAARRHITVVPEADMPGHTQAALAAYPWLGNAAASTVDVWTGWGISPYAFNTSDETLAFCRTVLDTVCELFPGRYIGIGGDECDSLQASFVAELVGHLAAKGRRAYGWDELSAVDGVTIAAWRGSEATVHAARAGHEVVACPTSAAYFDYKQSDDPGELFPVGPTLTLDDVYAFEPVPATLTPEEAERIIGVQCNVWTEQLDSARRIDYMLFPRLCALAEVAWSAGPRDDFRERLTVHLGRLDALGVEYRPLEGPRPWQLKGHGVPHNLPVQAAGAVHLFGPDCP